MRKAEFSCVGKNIMVIKERHRKGGFQHIRNSRRPTENYKKKIKLIIIKIKTEKKKQYVPVYGLPVFRVCFISLVPSKIAIVYTVCLSYLKKGVVGWCDAAG